MVELGQLESRSDDFAKLGTRIVAVSTDEVADAAETQSKFKRLVILSDADRSLANATKVLGPHQSPDGKVVVSPTTIVVDKTGAVKRVHRSSNFFVRQTPDEVLAMLK